jgi:hypothetical protein
MEESEIVIGIENQALERLGNLLASNRAELRHSSAPSGLSSLADEGTEHRTPNIYCRKIA